VSRETQAHVELLHTEGPGGVLGEIPVFGGGVFPATARAVEPTRCAHLPIAAVQRLLEDDPAFVRFALHRLANRARSLLQRIDDVTASTIPARVARVVLARASTVSSGQEFTMGVSQEALAAELGTAREVVVRALRALVATGALARAGRSRFVVRNESILRTISGDPQRFATQLPPSAL
jgi:CRP/FNR family transcriptional regulator